MVAYLIIAVITMADW